MISDILRVYSEDNKYIILNPSVPAWIVTNIAGIAVVKRYCECLSSEQTATEINAQNSFITKKSVSDFLEKAKEALLFDESKIEHIHKPYFLHGLYLNMTEKCNLRCSYCFASARTEKGKSYLQFDNYKQIISDAKDLSNGEMDIVFTGGEPLMSQNTITVASYAKSLGFSPRILTNATLIDDKNVKQLAEIFDMFKISIDGSTEEIHDSYRGRGSYAKTLHAIELLKKADANVQVAMTVTRKNANDISAMNKKWGSLLSFQPLFPLGRAKGSKDNFALSGKEYYATLCSNENINPFSDIENIIKAHSENHSIMKCAMGDGEISISCTGDVYPCQLLHHDEFYLGNVLEKPLKEIYNSEKNNSYKFHTVECIDKCKSCDFRYLCGAACQARHFSETGSLDQAGNFCEYEKRGIVHGIISSCKMVEM